MRWNGTAYEVDGQTIPADHGILALALTAPPQLLVAGATPTALEYAARALTTALPAAPALAVTCAAGASRSSVAGRCSQFCPVGHRTAPGERPG